MAREGKKSKPASEEELDQAAKAEEAAGEAEPTRAEDQEEEPMVSAIDMPGPETMVDAAPKGNIGGLKVSLAGERAGGPTLEDIQRINADTETDTRTPLMTVVLGILQHQGGAMTVNDLAAEVARYWNRPWPMSPYTPEELIFVVVRNSDHVRIEQ